MPNGSHTSSYLAIHYVTRGERDEEGERERKRMKEKVRVAQMLSKYQ